MVVIGIIFFIVLGAVVGSFLNDCIDRLPANQSLIFPPSHCASCQRRLGVRDLIPVLSYLSLRGRCRYCGAPIPRRILWVEVGTALLFGYLYWHYGLSFELAVALLYGSLFIVFLVIDLEQGLILNKMVLPAAGVALVISIFLPPSRLAYPETTTMASFFNSFLPGMGIVQAAIGGAVGLLVFLFIVIFSRGGMGWGDVKLAGLVGIITGYLVPVALFLGIVLGGLIAVILLVTGLRKRRQTIPFGPFLAVGAVAALLWGSALADWYLHLF